MKPLKNWQRIATTGYGIFLLSTLILANTSGCSSKRAPEEVAAKNSKATSPAADKEIPAAEVAAKPNAPAAKQDDGNQDDAAGPLIPRKVLFDNPDKASARI